MKGIFKKVSKKQLIFAAVSAGVLAAAFLTLHFSLGKELLSVISDRRAFKAWLYGFSVPPEIVFVLVRAVQTVVKIIPAEPLEIGSGYVWGSFGGFGLCMLGTEVGTAVILILTRVFGIRFVELFADTRRLGEWSFFSDSKRKYLCLFIIYLIPGTPKDFITYIAGLTKIRLFPFLLVTGVARIPSIISSTYCGSALAQENKLLFAVVFAVITVFSLLGAAAVSRRMKRRSAGQI